MKTLFTYKINRNGAYFALGSFMLNTFMFLFYMAADSDSIVGLGLIVLAINLILTPISLLALITNAILNFKDLKQHVVALFMLLVSISITFLYLKLISNF